MIKCSKECLACCDFCIYVIHEYFEFQGKMHKGGPIGSSLYTDQKHQDIAEACSYCEDFHCFRASEKYSES